MTTTTIAAPSFRPASIRIDDGRAGNHRCTRPAFRASGRSGTRRRRRWRTVQRISQASCRGRRRLETLGAKTAVRSLAASRDGTVAGQLAQHRSAGSGSGRAPAHGSRGKTRARLRSGSGQTNSPTRLVIRSLLGPNVRRLLPDAGTDIDRRQGDRCIPNDFEQDNLVSGGRILQVPSEKSPYQLRLKEKGTETLAAMCSNTIRN